MLKGVANSVPLVKGGENLMGGDLTQLNPLLCHGFQAFLEVGFAERERRRRGRAGVPRSPWKGGVVRWVVVFDWLREVDVAC